VAESSSRAGAGSPPPLSSTAPGPRPQLCPGTGATLPGHRAAGLWLLSPGGGGPQHLPLQPPGEAAAGEGPVFSSRSRVHSPGAQTKSQAAARTAQTTPNPPHGQHRAAALPCAATPSERLRGGAGTRAPVLPPAQPRGASPLRAGMGSDLCGVLAHRRWLQPLQLVEDLIYAGSLLGVQCHHGGEQALQGGRVPGWREGGEGILRGAWCWGLCLSRVTLPSPSPGRGGNGDGVLHCQSHAVALLEDGVVGTLPKHHAVQHAA